MFKPGHNRRWCRELSTFLGLLMLVMLGLALILIQPGPASAQEPIPTSFPISDDQVNAIAREMYCPVCENIPLDVCPTQACSEWRELIRDKLAEGWSEEQIKDYFVERFGDRVSSTPPLRGLNWLVYLVPPIAFITGSIFLFRAAMRQRERNIKEIQGNKPNLDSAEDAYIEKLEEELRKL